MYFSDCDSPKMCLQLLFWNGFKGNFQPTQGFRPLSSHTLFLWGEFGAGSLGTLGAESAALFSKLKLQMALASQ